MSTRRFVEDGEKCGAIAVEDAKCGPITERRHEDRPCSSFSPLRYAVLLHKNRAPLESPLHRALTPLVSRNVGIPELIALLSKLESNLVGSEPSWFRVQLILLLVLVLVLPLPLLTPDWPRAPGYLTTREDMVV